MRNLEKVAERAKKRVRVYQVVLTTVFSWSVLSATEKPNVLFIAVDDLNDWTGFAGHPDAITPNMDRLANEGIHFLEPTARIHCVAPRGPAS